MNNPKAMFQYTLKEVKKIDSTNIDKPIKVDIWLIFPTRDVLLLSNSK